MASKKTTHSRRSPKRNMKSPIKSKVKKGRRSPRRNMKSPIKIKVKVKSGRSKRSIRNKRKRVIQTDNDLTRSKVNNNNLSNLRKFVETKTASIITPHGEKIELPNKYPGDDYVFQYLYPNPEDNMELVDPQIFKELYRKYYRMCF